MARLTRICLPGMPQHIIQRGNNRQVCFGSEEDFSNYAYLLSKYSDEFEVSIHAWVFMTNHVHLLATPKRANGISSMMQALGRRYVRYFNYSYQRTGTLWEGRFKSCVVDAESYLLTCMRYIELNPVRANMVSSPDEYRWSSYHANGLCKQIELCIPHEVYTRLGKTKSARASSYRELFERHLDKDELAQVREAISQGMALGSDRFKQEIEQLSGRRVTTLRRGPKPKNK
jgi:putative transposase